MGKGSLLVLAAGLLAGGLAFWALNSPNPAEAPASLDSPSAELPPPPTSEETTATQQDEHLADSKLDETESTLPAHRQEVAAIGQRIEGLVLDASGGPIMGAEISWTPSRLGCDRAPRAEGTWRKLRDASAWTVSDENGSFELETPRQEKGVLWVTKTGFRGAYKWTEPGASLQPSFALEEAPALEVSLRRADGASIAGASIIYRGDSRRDLPLAELDDFSRARQLFLRVVEVQVDQAGPFVLPDNGERQLLFAEQKGLVSRGQLAGAPGEVELVLRPGFELDVQVEGMPADRMGRATLSVFTFGGDVMSRLLQLDATGHTRALLPLVDVDVYRTILSGGGLAADTADFPTPAPGERVTLTFEGRLGGEVPLLFTDPEGEPVAEVRAGINWDSPDGSPRTTFPMLHSGIEGKALLDSVPSAPFWIEYTHPDFVPWGAGPFELASLPVSPEGGFEPIEITLSPLGAVTGRVLGAGERLLDFKLFAWPVGSSAWDLREIDVTIDEDGAFRFRTEAGSLNLAAWSEGFAQCQPLQLEVDPQTDAEVELDLPVGVPGRGVVLDANTRAPIEGAEVWLELSSIGVPYYRLETPRVTDAAGTFEAQGFPPTGMVSVVVEAPGYIAARATATQPETQLRQDPIDFGTVLLARESTLDLTITGLRIDVTQLLMIAGTDAEWQPMQLTDGALTAHVTGIDSGLKELVIYTEDGPMALRQSMALEGGGPWIRELHLGAGFDVQVDLSKLDALPTNLYLTASFKSGDFGPGERQVQVSSAEREAGLATLAGIPAGPLTLKLEDDDRTLLAVGFGVVREGTTNAIQLDPAARELTVRVVDTDGLPISGTYVYASPPEMPQIDRFYTVTNEAGIASIGMVPFEVAHLRAVRSDGAFLSSVELPVPTDGEPLELVFDSDRSLAIHALDGEVPLGGLFVLVTYADEGVRAIQMPLDGDGVLRHGPVSDVDFDCHPMAPWVWPEAVRVHAVELGAAPATIQLRRRGDLVIRIIDQAGLPLAGIPVEVTDTTSGTPVAQWLSEGLVAAEPGGMMTDSKGELRLTGLPHGDFTWNAPTLSLAGTTIVPPLGEGLATGLFEQP